MLTSLAALHAAGVGVDWAAVRHSPTRAAGVALPTYPWQREAVLVARRPRPDSRASHLRLCPAAATAARLQADQGPLDLRVETYAERWELLDRLAAAYIAARPARAGAVHPPPASSTASTT